MKTKLYSLAATLLLFAASSNTASAEYYITGEFNKWGQDFGNVVFNENNGVYELTHDISGEFKIKDENDVWYGAYADGHFEFNSVNPSATLVAGDGGANLYLPFYSVYHFTIKDGVLSVEGFDYYISGDFNSWGAEKMQANADGTYTITKEITAGQQFKFRDYNTDASHWFGAYTGNSYPYELNSEWYTDIDLLQGNTAQNFIINIDGTYTFILTRDRKLTVLGFHDLLTLSNEGGNYTILEETSSDKALDVVIEGRTLYKDGSWNTICLPFDVGYFDRTIFEDATVMTLGSSTFDSETGTLSLNFVQKTSIEPGYPYLVKWNGGDDIVDPTFTNVHIYLSTPSQQPKFPGDEDIAVFKGCFDPYSLTAGDTNTLYLGADNTLYYADESSSVTIGAFRGYFELNLPETETEPSNIKAFVLNFDDETTSIEEITSPSNLSNPSNSFITLDGRRLNAQPTSAGLYIINGKKVIIK